MAYQTFEALLTARAQRHMITSGFQIRHAWRFLSSSLLLFVMASTAGGSDLFAGYEQDFHAVSDGIKNKIEQLIPNQSGGKFFDKLLWPAWLSQF